MAGMWQDVGINVDLIVSEYRGISQLQIERALTGVIYLTRLRPTSPTRSIASMWRKSNTPFYEYPFITDWKENYDATIGPVERDRLAQLQGDFWRDEHLSIPLLWIYGKAAYHPDVVEGYEVRHGYLGPVRYHEYTLPAIQ